MDTKTLKNHLKNLSEALEFFNQILDQQISVDNSETDQRKQLVENNELKRLLKQEVWPAAISEDLICLEEHEDDKLARAAEICKDVFKSDLEDKKILDFGCGEGHSAYVLATLSDAAKVIGYDIEKNQLNFETQDNLLFSNCLEEIAQEGPFDIILAHDVIDHCEDPLETLSTIKSLKKDTGKIYLRCHPWTSRHATHLYKTINKAYVHLVFSEDELYAMGIRPNFTFWTNNPDESYRNIFEELGLQIIQENKIKQDFELFFLTKPSILKRIKNNLQIEGKLDTDILEIQFIEYLLI